MTPIASLVLPALFLVIAPARAAEVVVHVTRSGEALEVEASAEFQGNIPRTWQVLTDYDRLADFIPDLQVSRVISRDGNRLEVEQKGQARLLFVGFPIDLRLAVTEYPYERLVSRAIAGNFREMLSTYRLEAGQGRVLLRYTGRIIPDFEIPPLIGPLIFRNNVETTFRALVNEIELRHGQPVLPDKE